MTDVEVNQIQAYYGKTIGGKGRLADVEVNQIQAYYRKTIGGKGRLADVVS